MAWTTDDLVSAVKRKVQSPSGGFQLTDQQILDTAWEETMKRIVPPVRAVREDYWTTTSDVSITASLNYVRIPSRAAQSTITDVWLLRADGSTKPLSRMPVERRFLFDTTQSAAEPEWYVLEGDKVIMCPVPTNSGMSVKFMYDRRPSKFLPVASCAIITAVGATTLTTTGSTISAGTALFDVVQADAPFDVLLQSTSATYSAGTTFTFASGVLTNKGIAVSDYVAYAGYTCVVPLADALHPALVDFTAAAIMSEIGDYERSASIRAEIGSYYEALINTFAIRVSGDPPRVFNRQSPIRQTGYSRGWWGTNT